MKRKTPMAMNLVASVARFFAHVLLLAGRVFVLVVQSSCVEALVGPGLAGPCHLPAATPVACEVVLGRSPAAKGPTRGGGPMTRQVN